MVVNKLNETHKYAHVYFDLNRYIKFWIFAINERLRITENKAPVTILYCTKFGNSILHKIVIFGQFWEWIIMKRLKKSYKWMFLTLLLYLTPNLKQFIWNDSKVTLLVWSCFRFNRLRLNIYYHACFYH